MEEQPERRRDVVAAIHEVHVVENDDARRARPLMELVEQLFGDVGQGGVSAKYDTGLLAAAGREYIERGDQAGPELGGVFVALVQREPRRRQGGVLRPTRQQHRLAGPGRGDDDRQRGGDEVVQQLEQALPLDVVLGSSGRAQLRSQQRGRQLDLERLGTATHLLAPVSAERAWPAGWPPATLRHTPLCWSGQAACSTFSLV